MKARRFLALLCSAIIVMSAMTGLFTTVSAVEIEGDWTVYRTPSS